jgi:hypothetical protein
VSSDRMAPSESLLGSAALSGLAGGLAGDAAAFSFFGIRDAGTRVVIAFDVSKSVLDKARKSGVPVEKIKEETVRLIGGMTANSSFGVVQFIRRYEVFQSRLLPGTTGNKHRAVQWVEREFHTTGFSPGSWKRIEDRNGQGQLDGVQAVLREIFEWEPDVIFILSDGGFGRNFPSSLPQIDLDELDRDIARLQRGLAEPARIHFVGFEMRPDREEGVRRMVRKWKGQFLTF